MYRETQTEHYEPLLVKSRPIVTACCVATVVLIGVALVTIGVGVVRVAITGSILVTVTSSFMLGSCYRLRDLRSRRGRLLRAQPENAAELAKLPPLEMVWRRIRVSRYATSAGVLGLAATTLIAFVGDYPQSAGQWSAVVSILAVVISALFFVAATYTRPLD